jgi:hypothetical protein
MSCRVGSTGNGYCMRLKSLSVVIALILSASSNAHSQYRVQIVASGLNEMRYTNNRNFGHAFMILKTQTRTGMKEDAFGFYPASENAAVPEMIIGTPGALKSEYRKQITAERLSRATVSFEMPISWTQKQALFEKVDRWNLMEYQLNFSNCMDFVDAIAVDVLHLPRVDRNALQIPNNYVAALKVAYEQKLEQERLAREEETRRRQQEDEANRIPPGWVPCSCPGAHSPYGKFVRGTLYHPDNVRCPQ